MPSGVLPNELSVAINKAMGIPKKELIDKEQYLTTKYMENFAKISTYVN
jgi:hypothetical protein